MTTILITAIGGDIAQGIATIIRETYPDWRLVGMDMNDRHGGSLFVDVCYKSPGANNPEYNDWLYEIIKTENIDLCIPMSEAELLYFTRLHIDKISDAALIMPNFKAIEIGSDKLATANFIESIGCPGPWTMPADEAAENITLPCIYKPRRSAGSKSIFQCKTIEEIFFYRKHYPGGIFQELLLPGDREVTCAVYRTNSKLTVVLQLLRTLVGGFTGWAQVIDNSEIVNQCTKLAEALDLKGAINIQLRITKNGPRIFEINPRFSSTVLIRHRMGFQDVVWTLQEFMGEKINIYMPSVGTTAVRVQGANILK